MQLGLVLLLEYLLWLLGRLCSLVSISLPPNHAAGIWELCVTTLLRGTHFLDAAKGRGPSQEEAVHLCM